jgi:zeaxanthin glucosyltransferase
MLNHLPDAVTELGVQALVIDTIHVFVELVAIRLNIPYIHIWNILHIDRSGMTPPCFVSLPYEDSPDAREKYAAGVVDMGRLFSAVTDVAREYAAEHNLGIDWSKPGATVSKLAVITQTPKVFDFPKLACPPQFHYTGPFHDPGSRSLIPFPWERVTAERMIYGSLGTLVNGLEHVYRKIIAASAMIPGTQLVLSIGNNIRLEDLGKLPGNAIVVRSAPQLELLKRAHLCITHAGANTVLESLAAGVPMIAIPIGFDQPGMAARVAYHGVGEFLEEENLTSDKLKALITTIMDDPNYKTRAVQMRDEIAAIRGLERAVTIIEQTFEEALLSQESEGHKAELLHR